MGCLDWEYLASTKSSMVVLGMPPIDLANMLDSTYMVVVAMSQLCSSLAPTYDLLNLWGLLHQDMRDITNMVHLSTQNIGLQTMQAINLRAIMDLPNLIKASPSKLFILSFLIWVMQQPL